MPGIWRPYLLMGYKSIAGSATATVELAIGETEEFEGDDIRIHATSASFDIIAITDQAGVPYTNTTSSVPIDGNLLTASTKNEFHILDMKIPLHLPPGTRMRFQVTDTSASTNEIFILITGKMRTAG